MRQKLLKLMLMTAVLISLVVFLPIVASAETSGIYTYNVSNGEATITECDESASGAIEIPSTLGGYPVTAISEYAFSNCSSLTSITIPNSVEAIGNYAFIMCTNLQSITIPKSVESIGTVPFGFCTNLKSITVEEGNQNYCAVDNVLFDKNMTTLIQYSAGKEDSAYTIPYGVKTICYMAFTGCGNLTEVSIPVTVTDIEFGAFYACGAVDTESEDALEGFSPSLKSITVEEGNPNYCSVDGVLFSKDKTTLVQYPVGKETETYIIPNSVKKLGEMAFVLSINLESITIPNSVESIGEMAFTNCAGLTDVTLGKGVKIIGNYAFAGCSSLTSITIPNSVEAIGSHTFDSCSSLTSITIPNSVEAIGDYAFYGCSSLTSIIIPNSVKTIGYYAFYGCNNLNTIYYTGSEEEYSLITIRDGNGSIQSADVIYNCDGMAVRIGTLDYYILAAPIGYGELQALVEFDYVQRGGTLYVALYDEDDNLVDVKIADIAADSTSQTVDFGEMTKDVTGYKLKAFYWESDNVIPMSKAVETKIS